MKEVNDRWLKKIDSMEQSVKFYKVPVIFVELETYVQCIEFRANLSKLVGLYTMHTLTFICLDVPISSVFKFACDFK